jgi:hypothetical protein
MCATSLSLPLRSPHFTMGIPLQRKQVVRTDPICRQTIWCMVTSSDYFMAFSAENSGTEAGDFDAQARLARIALVLFGGDQNAALDWIFAVGRLREIAGYVADAEESAAAMSWLAPVLSGGPSHQTAMRTEAIARLLFNGSAAHAVLWICKLQWLQKLADVVCAGDVNATLAWMRPTYVLLWASAAVWWPALDTNAPHNQTPQLANPQTVASAEHTPHLHREPVVSSMKRRMSAPMAGSSFYQSARMLPVELGIPVDESRPTPVTATSATATIRGQKPPRPHRA